MDKAQVLKWASCRWIGLMVVLLPGVYAGQLNTSELEVYPGAELVASNVEKKNTNRRVILGSLKKINNILEPKSYIYVEGGLSSNTYYIPGEKRVKRVAEFYEHQMNTHTEILFSCQGRSCGSSNYWADIIFQLPILYGPEQYQSYFVGLSNDKVSYIALYVAQRGTRKIYVHEQVIRISAVDRFAPDLSADLMATGRIVIPLTSTEQSIDDIVDELATLLNKNRSLNVTLVAHDSMHVGESIEDSTKRTLIFAESVKSGLIISGIASERLDAYGLGPLAPLTSVDSPRIEVLVIP